MDTPHRRRSYHADADLSVAALNIDTFEIRLVQVCGAVVVQIHKWGQALYVRHQGYYVKHIKNFINNIQGGINHAENAEINNK